ncbi:zinc ribbon domain-containing protein [Lysinibacillus sp. NPDC097214]|uniref:zinc ribbon domain-containing protein n=1 Tax=Lysinibacillus sp. NPDC097214 TaxID=3390584 RepID=UPI003D043D9B
MQWKTSRKQTKTELKEYTYYVCSTHVVKHRGKCTWHSMSIEDITEIVLRAFKRK